MMRAVWLAAIVGVVCAGTAAYAERGVYFPGLMIGDNPSAAEQRAFVQTIVQKWDLHPAGYNDNATCTPLLEDLKAGTNVNYLEPVAFGKSSKPEAMLALERQCPHLYLDRSWKEDRREMSLSFVEPVTDQEKTDTWGEPVQATENFKLYEVPLPGGGAPRPVSVADRSCLEGKCSYGFDYRLIDPKKCVQEIGMTLFPNRDANGANVGPALLWTVVQIKGVPYFLEAGDTSVTGRPPPYQPMGPGISIRRIPSDVQLHRIHEPSCDLYSYAAPRR